MSGASFGSNAGGISKAERARIRAREWYRANPERAAAARKAYAVRRRDITHRAKMAYKARPRAKRLAAQADLVRRCAHCQTDISSKSIQATHCSDRCWAADARGTAFKRNLCLGCATDITYRRSDARFCSRKCCRAMDFQKNKSKHRARTAGRKAATRLPKSKSERQRIEKIYQQAADATRKSGIKHHVDHIKPLARGGKHHSSNLRVIPFRMNLRKGAKLLPAPLVQMSLL